jgi:hypothetical protein
MPVKKLAPASCLKKNNINEKDINRFSTVALRLDVCRGS